MARRDLFEFPCPCCGKQIEVNVRSGKARAVHFEESEKGKSFDGLLADAKEEGTRLGGLLDEARRSHDKDAERLQDLFDQSRDAAKDDPDDKPRSPFDLD